MAPDHGTGFSSNHRHAGWREQVLLGVLTAAIVLGGFIAAAHFYNLVVSHKPTSPWLIVAIYLSYFSFFPLRFSSRLPYRFRAVLHHEGTGQGHWTWPRNLLRNPMLLREAKSSNNG